MAVFPQECTGQSRLSGQPNTNLSRYSLAAETLAYHQGFLARCAGIKNGTVPALRSFSASEVCHYIIQPLVELYGDCMVVLKVS
jgi:hypothetical protein